MFRISFGLPTGPTSTFSTASCLLGNPDSSGPVWWRNASLPTELMGHRACGYRLRSSSWSGLAGGRGALPNSPLRLRVDGPVASSARVSRCSSKTPRPTSWRRSSTACSRSCRASIFAPGPSGPGPLFMATTSPSFREYFMPSAWFPRSTLLGFSVNRGPFPLAPTLVRSRT